MIEKLKSRTSTLKNETVVFYLTADAIRYNFHHGSINDLFVFGDE